MTNAYKGKRKRDVLFNIPNVLGYIRLVAYTLAIWRALNNDYVSAACLYVLHQVLDKADGIIARGYNQCSTFGAALDIAIDWAGSSMWYGNLCRIYPDYGLFFLANGAVEVFGELISARSFEALARHNVRPDVTVGYRIYDYFMKSKHLRDWVIYGIWSFWLMIYLLKYTDGPIVPAVNVGLWVVMLWLSLPFLLIRWTVRVAEICFTLDSLVCIDIDKDLKKGYDGLVTPEPNVSSKRHDE